MPYLLLFTIINSVVSSRGFQIVYRLNVAGVELGVLEGTIGVGILCALIFGPGIRLRQPTYRMHPCYIICMTLLLLGFACGVFGSLLHDAQARWKMVFMREYFAMPASIFIGYSLCGTLKWTRKIPYSFVLAGIGVSCMLLAHFERGAERYELHGDYNALRSISFVTSYAGTACALLVFSVISGQKLFPMLIALAIAGFCFIGQLAPLHRSDWISLAACIAAVPFCLPSGSRFKHAIMLVLTCLALAVSLWVGLHLASAVTGRNFHKTFEERLVSMLPGERTKRTDTKAWDTRLPAINAELQMWMTNPVMGRGFAIEEAGGLQAAADVGMGFHHNAYTSTLAQVGLIGFAGVMMAIYCPIFVGYKLVRDRWDRNSILIGALGIISGVQMAVLGMATASFNAMRHAMMIGLITGIVFRVRDLVQTEQRLAAEYAPGHAPGGFEVAPGEMLPIPDFDDMGRPIPGY